MNSDGIPDDLKTVSDSDLASVKARMEILKMRTEVADAKYNQERGRIISSAVSVVTVGISLLGVYLGASHFGLTMDSDKQKSEAQLAQDRNLKKQERQHEVLRDFEKLQLTTYFNLCHSAATIAALPDDDPRYAAERLTFFKLYRGDALIVGNQSLSAAMNRFDSCLEGRSTPCQDNGNPRQDKANKQSELQAISLELVNACRASIRETTDADVTQSSEAKELFRSYPSATAVTLP